MENWDKVQWYELIMIVLGTTCAITMDGQPRPNYDFKIHFVGLCVSLPIIGRIFGWW